MTPVNAAPQCTGDRSAPGGPFRSPKIQSWHLDRMAIVYVRQSTVQQVAENRESTERQYALVRSGHRTRLASRPHPHHRRGPGQERGRRSRGGWAFSKLLAEVGLDHVGLILGLEMSRLARSCKDWHQLVELCAIFRALLADSDGLYDPTDHNDRLLLGLTSSTR